MARRSEHTQEQIREMVLNAAEKIIIEDGVGALTARKVAMEIGYTVGSIYMVFTNMDDLIVHVKAKALDELLVCMRDVKSGDNVEERIQTMAEIYLDFADQHFNRWRMILDANQRASEPEWYREKVQEIFSMVDGLCRTLLPGQSEQQVHLAARSLWAGVHGICELALNGSLGKAGADKAETIVGLLVQNFIRGWKQTDSPADAKPRKKSLSSASPPA